MNPTKIILPITPQTSIRMTQGDKTVFRIPEKCYKGRSGTGCAEWRRTGFCKHTLNKAGRLRKRRIEKYNRYKDDLRYLAKKARFTLLDYGCSIYFYFPVPKRWSEADKIAMHGQPHQRRCDLDNAIKAFLDSLRHDDERVAQFSGVGKFWVNAEEGFIEILQYQEPYNPFGVPFIDQSKIKSLTYNEEYNRRRREPGYKPQQRKIKIKEDRIK